MPEYLSLFLNGVAGNIQAVQWARGGALHSIMQDDLGCFLIPLAPRPKQELLGGLALQAESARKRARLLLEQAKRAVEIAIEENEDAAMKFLKQSQEAL